VFLFLYVFNIFSAIVLYVCLSVLVLWASLPEIKIDDDDDDDKWKNKKVKKRYAQKCRYIVCGIRAVSPEEGKP